MGSHCDESTDPGSPAGSSLVDQSKAPPGTSTHLGRATTSPRSSRPTTPANNSDRMTKAHILNFGNGWRLGLYQGADREL
jgi:hypothetical protein